MIYGPYGQLILQPLLLSVMDNSTAVGSTIRATDMPMLVGAKGTAGSAVVEIYKRRYAWPDKLLSLNVAQRLHLRIVFIMFLPIVATVCHAAVVCGFLQPACIYGRFCGQSLDCCIAVVYFLQLLFTVLRDWGEPICQPVNRCPLVLVAACDLTCDHRNNKSGCFRLDQVLDARCNVRVDVWWGAVWSLISKWSSSLKALAWG